MISTTRSNIPPKQSVSTDFKKRFLLEFTRQLILNSAPLEVLKLREIIKEDYSRKKIEQRDEIKEKVKEALNPDDVYEKSNMPKESFSGIEKSWAKPNIKRKSFPFETFKSVRLTIPETNLPERLRYLMPSPVNQDIDLGKLSPLIKDHFVRTIECRGPNSNILVTGKMGEKKTSIILDNNEINEIIQIFSQASKIPVQEGIYKVAVGRLIFMAIISDIVGSRFIIKKMISTRLPRVPMGG